MQKKELLALMQNPAQLAAALEGEDAEVVKGLVAKLSVTVPVAEAPPAPLVEAPAQKEAQPEAAPAPAPVAATLSAEELVSSMKSTIIETVQATTKASNEAVLAQLKAANEEQMGALKKQVEDLAATVESKLAPVPGGPLTAGGVEQKGTTSQAGEAPQGSARNVVKHAAASDMTTRLMQSMFAESEDQ